MFEKRRTSLRDRSVLVNLCTGTAVAGVCVFDGAEQLVLRGATVHEPDSDPAPADGEIVIDRINVDFIQIP